MWLATGSAWMRLVPRQLQFDSRIRLQTVRYGSRSLPRNALDLKSLDYEDVDIIQGEHDYPPKGTNHRESLDLKAKKLSEVLECDEDTTREILKSYPGILSRPLERLLWTARYLKFRYPKNDIIKYPSALNLSWRLIENRRLIFEEIQAKRLNSVSGLLLCEQLSALTLFELCRRRIISTVNLLPSILSKIENCPPGLSKHLSKTLTCPSVLSLSLTEYRRIIIEEYFATWFGESKLRTRTLRMLERQSIWLISTRMNILVNELNLEPGFLQREQAFLLVNTHNLHDVTDKLATICNMPLAEMVRVNPAILGISAQKLCEVEKILIAQKARERDIARLPEVYNIHPDLFKEEFPFGDPEQEANSDSTAFMQWMHFGDISKRLGILAARNQKRMSDDPDYKRMQDMKKSGKFPSLPEILAAQIGADAEQLAAITETLSRVTKKQSRIAPHKCSATCNYLLKEGICTKAQLCKNILICMWSLESVQKIWEDFPREFYEKALGPEWQSHPYLTEMLMYEMVCLGVSHNDNFEVPRALLRHKALLPVFSVVDTVNRSDGDNHR